MPPIAIQLLFMPIFFLNIFSIKNRDTKGSRISCNSLFKFSNKFNIECLIKAIFLGKACSATVTNNFVVVYNILHKFYKYEIAKNMQELFTVSYL